MKRIVMVVLLFTVMCHAKNKKKNEPPPAPPTYPYTGKVVHEITVHRYDYESHISTQAGSADAYCDVTPTAAYCSDSSILFASSEVLLEGEDEDSKVHHQKWSPLILADQSTEDSCSPFHDDLCNPMRNLEETARKNAEIVSRSPKFSTMRGEVTFKYRLLTSPIQKPLPDWQPHDYREYYCLPIGSPKLERNQKAKSAEACYRK